ncbi:hypothetical protein Ddc_14390 [Ditylenchus destructor]|nr:hypothetical protein Ddc_14390 [Ditylenchus destructor]
MDAIHCHVISDDLSEDEKKQRKAFGSKASPTVPYKTLSRMDAIHRHVIFEVLKFIPFENARNLLTTHKSWLKPLKAQLEKQRKASLEPWWQRTFLTIPQLKLMPKVMAQHYT